MNQPPGSRFLLIDTLRQYPHQNVSAGPSQQKILDTVYRLLIYLYLT